MKHAVFMLGLGLAVPVGATCVLQDRTVVRSEVIIEERSDIRRDVVPYFEGQRKCSVSFRVRIGPEWHAALGEHVWSGDVPAGQACAVAVSRAEDEVRSRVGRSRSVGEKILICQDDDRLRTLPTTQIGTVADLHQFRPHPDRPRSFHHNGTICRWFLDSTFTGRDVRTYQGIVCQIQDRKWVVVDKF